MEAITKEVIRYIDVRFKEKDLTEIKEEIDFIENEFKANYYTKTKIDKIPKLLELREIVKRSIEEVHA